MERGRGQKGKGESLWLPVGRWSLRNAFVGGAVVNGAGVCVWPGRLGD